jgi:hypothetical protein
MFDATCLGLAPLTRKGSAEGGSDAILSVVDKDAERVVPLMDAGKMIGEPFPICSAEHGCLLKLLK